MKNVISFQYSGTDEGDFLELAELTTAQATAIMVLLARAERRGKIKPGFYVGPEQAQLTTFDDLYAKLRKALDQ